MYYLTYRPQTIEEVDNEAVRTRLSTVIRSGKIPHAMLFTGPKGTGKTSTARIVAKTINCIENRSKTSGDVSSPCNKCPECKAITEGVSIDVVEIDGASNRRIDDIRELIASTKYAPATGVKKVYIIDEVHMLTPEAFNALLKTLEEPPKHVLFLLATTELEKLPKTIISRCFQITVPKPSHAEIIHMLSRIARAEKLDISNEILTYIAKHSDSSFRDASKILEEAVMQKNINIESISSIIGLSDQGDNLLLYLQDKNEKRTIHTIVEYEKRGGSIKILIENMLYSLQEELLASKGIEGVKNTYSFSIKETVSLMKKLQEAYSLLKISPLESLPLEIAVVEYLDEVG